MTVELLAESEARARRVAHEQRVGAWIEPHLARRSRGVAHPVDDFLFTYYSGSPAALRRWHPGPGFAVPGREGELVAATAGYRLDAAVAVVDTDVVLARSRRIQAMARLLDATSSRRPMLTCFGLHEWAMVYRSDGERRHVQLPLRLGSEGTDAVVDAHRLACTHHDALRFFTPAATPRNAHRTSRATQPDLEQPGCLHAGMDLYKWATQLVPLVSAETVADCFALAREIREVDMRASPYDLSDLGYQPIMIETVAGKAQYVAAQRAFSGRAAPLRRRLLAATRHPPVLTAEPSLPTVEASVPTVETSASGVAQNGK